MTDTTRIRESRLPSDSADVLQRLRHGAEAAASWNIDHRPTSPGTFRRRMEGVSHTLTRVAQKLASHRAAGKIDRSHLEADEKSIRELNTEIRTLRSVFAAASSAQEQIARLPRVVSAGGKEEPRVAIAARTYMHAVEGEFSASTFNLFIQALQAYEPLTVEELWNFGLLLQFVLLESVLDDALALLSSTQPGNTTRLLTSLKSIKVVSRTGWNNFVEPLIAFDVELRQDPDGVYERMDFENRQIYRKRVSFIARHSDCTESEVAQAVLDLARDGARRPAGDPRERQRRAHVGYYLVDNGFPRLAHVVGFHPSLAWRMRQTFRKYGEDFYLGGVLLLSFAVAEFTLLPILPQFATIWRVFLLGLFLVPQAVQIATEFINHVITALFEPEPLPRLDFSEGVPRECTTLVAVPTLLLNEDQVHELVHSLEVRFLANRDPRLHFALLTDLPDSITKPHEHDSHPLVELAIGLIDELNAKYGSRGTGSFLLLHRHRIFNKRQGVWMSWERKRGKLLDLNSLLAREFDAFPIKAGRVDLLKDVRYILTLDSDTQLPRGTAAKLVGAIAHPLNQAIIDPERRIVTSGYGILQPRVGIAIRSAVRSRLSAIFSGQSGFDIYSRAVSDAYQDLFGEGIFTGKGIYEVATLHAVLNHRFPRNSLLSHDLIEGAYARAGLVSDVEVIDDYPSSYGAYSRRQHRWIRGDWQIAQWIFSKVPDETGRQGPNPISAISRWKIFDNLLRSLIDPSLVILFVAGWLGLPGGPLYWTLAVLLLLLFPAIIQAVFGLARALAYRNIGQAKDTLSALGRATLVRLLRLCLLLYQTWVIVDAVFRSLIRRFVTGERLLEWETAAESELLTSRNGMIDRYLAATSLTAVGLAFLITFFATRHSAILISAPILLMWGLSSFVTAWLNRPPNEETRIHPHDKKFLLDQALRTWRFFSHFGTGKHNYLIPDNVVEESLIEAPRVSPTNIGMLLNARQAACELGFLTTPEFAFLTSQSIGTIHRLEKFNGHLFNWYDTHSLQPLPPRFVSSVDSANYVASLYTLRAGARGLRRVSLLRRSLFAGLQAHWHLMRAEKGMPPELSNISIPASSAKMTVWINWIMEAREALATIDGSHVEQRFQWRHETLNRLDAIANLLHSYLPWMMPDYASLRAHLPLDPGTLENAPSLEGAADLAGRLESHIDREWLSKAPYANEDLALRFRETLNKARINLHELSATLRTIEHDAEALAEATEFKFLVHPERQVLSIGYDFEGQRLSDSCYDLFASEARLATFLAIARGDLPLESWFKLDREHAYALGSFLPYSWTGTSFEYLMPGLWMRSYRGTLIAQAESACVEVQRAFGKSLGLPWGISESGSAQMDAAGNYGYRAYGVPAVALSPEATAGPVISPYSTFLALGSDPYEALRNLGWMRSAGWVGAYGYYEAADYIASRRTPTLVREWMAHHQGMSLLAVANLLCDHVVQRWFHANAMVQANELLLHEVPASNSVLKARRRELALRGDTK